MYYVFLLGNIVEEEGEGERVFCINYLGYHHLLFNSRSSYQDFLFWEGQMMRSYQIDFDGQADYKYSPGWQEKIKEGTLTALD